MSIDVGSFCLQSKRLEDAKRNLEDETLKRTDLQNQLLSLEESNKFDRSMLENQLSETRQVQAKVWPIERGGQGTPT